MSSHAETTLFVVAVAVIIRREGTLLAMRRDPTKDAGPGLWEALSGRVKGGEAPLEAAAREVDEESGLVVRINPRLLSSYPATRLGLPMIVIVYAADHMGGVVTLSEEHDRYRRLSPEAFADLSTLTPLIRAARLAFSVER